MTWTRLTGVYVKKKLVVRLRFGEPSDMRWLRHGVTQYWFAPGQVFGVLSWARLSPRKQVACFAVVEALAVGEAGTCCPRSRRRCASTRSSKRGRLVTTGASWTLPMR